MTVRATPNVFYVHTYFRFVRLVYSAGTLWKISAPRGARAPGDFRESQLSVSEKEDNSSCVPRVAPYSPARSSLAPQHRRLGSALGTSPCQDEGLYKVEMNYHNKGRRQKEQGRTQELAGFQAGFVLNNFALRESYWAFCHLQL